MTFFERLQATTTFSGSRFLVHAALAGMFFLLPSVAEGQFDSGSSGADGALSFICAAGGETIEWDAAGLDPEGDRIFHFTTITVPADCTILFRQRVLGPKPIIWLATGEVIIDGTLDLSGDPGHGNAAGTQRMPSLPGPGGFAGGVGPVQGVGTAFPGLGPGGGKVAQTGGGAGHASNGGERFFNTSGSAYGTPFLRPLLGGSGGAAGTNGGGGGAGGGAILVASTTEIHVGGTLRANGGGIEGGTGGGGSGGAIRLVAPIVDGSGLLQLAGGNGQFSSDGSGGRLRIETNDYQFTGSTAVGSQRTVTLAPTTVLFSPDDPQFPILRITSVNGIPVPPNPTGSFNPADVTINEVDPVDVQIEAENVPIGTVVTVDVHNETTGTTTFDSPPLAGTEELSVATANGLIDPGFSLVTLRASFTP